MKRIEVRKKPDSQNQQTKKGTIGQKLLTSSTSMDCLFDKSTKQIKQRKASTPTHDGTALSNSPDISCIRRNEAESFSSRVKVNSHKLKETGRPKTEIQKGIILQHELDMEYTKYLQAVFKNALVKSKCSKIDNNLASLQLRIEDNDRILRQTNERLKNISFNKEIDALHKLQNPNYSKILETMDSTNCEEYISKLNTKLEQTQNQLKIKNIEIPQGGGAQLMKAISETLSAFEKLETQHDSETPRILKEIKDINKSTVSSLVRCKNNLSTCEDLLLTRAALETSSQQNL